ncbi:MAG: hypothetical protein HQL01_10280 [Nitrospirae bacterium]|nr:hypothetical protein [Nitrospirota bacterium]
MTSDKLGNDSYYARQANPYRGYGVSGAEPPVFIRPANRSKTAESPRGLNSALQKEQDVVLALSKNAKDSSKITIIELEDGSKRSANQEKQNKNNNPQDNALAFVPNSPLTVSLNKHKADPQFQKAYEAYGKASTVAYDIRTVDIYV